VALSIGSTLTAGVARRSVAASGKSAATTAAQAGCAREVGTAPSAAPSPDVQHPLAYVQPVRQLLGHKDVRTTISFYVGLEEDANFKRDGQILDRLIASEEDDHDL
jgi:hypothetical protein